MRLTAMEIDILTTISGRGTSGITKDELMLDLSRSVKGMAYADLRRHLESLAERRLVSVEETGPDDFTVAITTEGSKAVRK